MANKRNCGQVTIPKVDNKELDCDEFVRDLCIKVDYPAEEISGNLNPSLQDFLNQYLLDKNQLLREIKARDLIIANLQDDMRKVKHKLKL